MEWRYCESVFRLERRLVRIPDDKVSDEVSCAVKSLPRDQIGADRLPELERGHWSIETKLHSRRADTLKEDSCRLRGRGAQAMAVINNLVLGLLRNTGFGTVPDARRHHAAHPAAAGALVLRSP